MFNVSVAMFKDLEEVDDKIGDMYEAAPSRLLKANTDFLVHSQLLTEDTPEKAGLLNSHVLGEGETGNISIESNDIEVLQDILLRKSFLSSNN